MLAGIPGFSKPPLFFIEQIAGTDQQESENDNVADVDARQDATARTPRPGSAPPTNRATKNYRKQRCF